MDFQIAISGGKGSSVEIYRALRTAILSGRLRANQALPSTRELAGQLQVARKTVLRAYERLSSESLVEAQSGSGTRVSARLRFPTRVGPRQGSVLRPRAEWLSLERPAGRQLAYRFDFSVGIPDVSLFPFALWRSLLASSSRVLGAAQGVYANPQGDPRLRAAIAEYVAFTRAVVCNPDQIVVTRGAQQALDLLARVLLRPGDAVAVEEPGYPPVRELLAMSGMQVNCVDLDREGIRVAELPANARLVYVTPSHQFPLGTPMSLERKFALLRWAAEHRACIVEDDYDSEYRFDPRPLESLQSLDRFGVVAYVGTFSKLLHPGLRMGFIVAPATLVPALCAARQLSDSHEAAVWQHVLARFITEGHLRRHVRRMARIYAGRRAVLLNALSRSPDIFGEIVPSVAGLHVTCLQISARHTKDLLRRAKRHGVYVADLSAFATRPGLPGIVLGYGAITERNIVAGLQKLSRPD